MSTRSRTRPTSYAARVQRRAVAPRRRRRVRVWLTDSRLLALLALAAETGHLATAVAEWPASAARGVFHVLAGAVLGLIAVSVYFGHGRIGHAVLALVLVCSWPAGAVGGMSPYLRYPPFAAIATVVVELGFVALLVVAQRSASAVRFDGRSPS